MNPNLVIQTAFLGDLLLSLPLLKNLKLIFPEQELVLVCRSGLGEFFRVAKVADEVIEVNKKNKTLWSEQVQSLSERAFHHVICPHESLRSAQLVRNLKAEGHKVGFHHYWNFFAFDKRVRRPDDLPDALRQLSLLTALNSRFAEEYSQVASFPELRNVTHRDSPVDFRKVAIPEWASMKWDPPTLNEDVYSWLPALKSSTKWPGIFLAPGSVWATKRWTHEGYSELAKKLVGRGYDVVLLGSADEFPLCERIQNEVPEVSIAAGRLDIPQTVALMSRGLALVSNDSGSMHMASVAGLPTVSIFGPTTLDIGYRPWQESSLVVQKDMKCRPCGKHGSDRCPIGTHECMRGISTEQVLAALNALL